MTISEFKRKFGQEIEVLSICDKNGVDISNIDIPDDVEVVNHNQDAGHFEVEVFWQPTVTVEIKILADVNPSFLDDLEGYVTHHIDYLIPVEQYPEIDTWYGGQVTKISEPSGGPNTNEVQQIPFAEAAKIIFERKPLGKFLVREVNNFIGVDNSSGNPWVETFEDEGSCREWLEGQVRKGEV